MKKIIIAIISVIIILCVPVIGLPLYAAAIPDVYGNTYLAAMADKHTRLHSLIGKKIILVGGSSMAFGVDCSAIERELGIQTVNMGLYAALGSKTTLDLTLSGVGKDDVVVFAPEMDKQAYSMYTNTEITVQTLESKRSMVWNIPVSEWGGLFSQLPQYISAKKELLKNGIPDPQNAYARKAFNEYGDNVYDRPYNVMPDMFLSTNMIDITEELIDHEFIDYVNDYAAKVRKKGGEFYFSFPPMNRLALTENSTRESRDAVFKALRNALNCEIIGNIEGHIFNEGYFFDSNYHLNNSGIPCNTKELVGDLKRMLGDSSPIDIDVLPPSGRENADDTPEIDDSNSEDFEYVEDTAGFAITSVKQSAAGKGVLSLPRSYEGKTVYKIKSGAFVGCSAHTINIGDNITVLEDGIFDGCSNLTTVNLSVKLEADAVLPSVGGGLLDRANPDIVIYVPPIKFTTMTTDYFWAIYGKYLKAAQ